MRRKFARAHVAVSEKGLRKKCRHRAMYKGFMYNVDIDNITKRQKKYRNPAKGSLPSLNFCWILSVLKGCCGIFRVVFPI